jgi:hypothetical protein
MGSKLNCAICCAGFLTLGERAVAGDMLVQTPLDARPWMNPILIANTQVGLGIAAHRVDYRETMPSFPNLDSENGWLPGVTLGVSAMAPIGAVTNLYVMGAFTWIRGQTEYAATIGPVTADRSGADIKTLDLRLGKGFDVAADWMVTPYLGVGYRGWERDLGTSFRSLGYHELYEHGYVGGGVLVQWAATDRIVLSVTGLAGATFAPRMGVSYNGGAPMDPRTYSLGSSTIYMAGLSADYAIGRDWHANAGLDVLSFRYGASAVAPNGTFEPDSRTSTWTVKAGFGYSFSNRPLIAAQN